MCGDNMSWLQLVPDGQSHVLTAKYYLGKIAVWYTDIIEQIAYDPDGVAVFIDKFLDVVFTPQGDLTVDDRDELDAALAEGVISQEQHAAALRECDVIMDTYCVDVAKTAILCDNIMAHILSAIANDG